jgi:hypothetical protein
MKPESSRVATRWGRRIGVQWLHLGAGRLDEVFAANRAEQDSTRLFDIQDRDWTMALTVLVLTKTGGGWDARSLHSHLLRGGYLPTAVAVEKQEDELTLTTTVVFSFD